MLEVCHTTAICIDRNRMFANRLNVEYTLDLAVRNVELLNVSSFVMGGAYVRIADFSYYGFCLPAYLGHPNISW